MVSPISTFRAGNRISRMGSRRAAGTEEKSNLEIMSPDQRYAGTLTAQLRLSV